MIVTTLKNLENSGYLGPFKSFVLYFYRNFAVFKTIVLGVMNHYTMTLF